MRYNYHHVIFSSEEYRRTAITADTHFGHKNILEYSNRPFGSIEEHDEELIENIRDSSYNNDILIHLGDLCFSNGEKYVNFLTGLFDVVIFSYNPTHHDKRWIRRITDDNLFFVAPIAQIYVKEYDEELELNGNTDLFKPFVISHFPLESWQDMYYNSIHMHGHVHNNDGYRYLKNRWNIGVDNSIHIPNFHKPFYPIPLEAIVEAS